MSRTAKTSANAFPDPKDWIRNPWVEIPCFLQGVRILGRRTLAVERSVSQCFLHAYAALTVPIGKGPKRLSLREIQVLMKHGDHGIIGHLYLYTQTAIQSNDRRRLVWRLFAFVSSSPVISDPISRILVRPRIQHGDDES